jgi:phage shock protein E
MFNLTRVMKKTILTGAMLMASTSLWAAEHWIDVRTQTSFRKRMLKER